MNFQETLRSVLKEVEGAQAAILMGLDGIPIAEVKNESASVSLQDLSVEYGQLLSEATKIAHGNQLGSMCEMVFSMDKGTFVLRVVGNQYFLGLLLSHPSNVGKGRYALRRLSPDIQTNL